MVNTDKVRIYPADKKFLNDICDIADITHADLMHKVLNSNVIKTKEALKKFAEETLEEKRRRMG